MRPLHRLVLAAILLLALSQVFLFLRPGAPVQRGGAPDRDRAGVDVGLSGVGLEEAIHDTHDTTPATKPHARPPSAPTPPLSMRYGFLIGGFFGITEELLFTACLAQQLADVNSAAPLLIFNHANIPFEHQLILKSLPNAVLLPQSPLLDLTDVTHPDINPRHVPATNKVLFLDPPDTAGIEKFVWLDQDIFVAENIDELFGLPHISSPFDRKGCDVDGGLGASSGILVAERDPASLAAMKDRMYERKKNIRSDQDLIMGHFVSAGRWHPLPQTYQHMPSDCFQCTGDTYSVT